MAYVAVVEDHCVLREQLSTILERRGHTVQAFESFRPAMEALSLCPPDLLITDVCLPDGSGLELVARMRDQHAREFPVIITSGLQSEEDFKRGFVAGATDYISKPFRPDELLAKTDMHLARSLGDNTQFVGLGLPGGSEQAFGRYAIQGILGRGAHGAVYSAIDRTTHEPVALKVLSSVGCAQNEARLRFLREIYSVSAVDNPHIVAVRDFGIAEGRLYFAMEQVSGPTLRSQIKHAEPATPQLAAALLLGLTRALCALHEAGILHRDVSPANVILRDGNWTQPVLVDFGLAKREFDHGITSDDLVMGTPGYLDPALLLDATPSVQSDLYSAAMVVRFGLTGRGWLGELSGLKRVQAMARASVTFPDELPSSLHALLTHLTEPDPALRPASAGEVISALVRDRTRGQ